MVIVSAWTRLLTGRARWPMLVSIAVLTAVLGFGALQSDVELGNESMTSRDKTEGQAYADFVGWFGSEDSILVGYSDARMPGKAGMAELIRLAGRLREIDGVTRIVSLDDVTEVVSGAFGAEERPLLPPLEEIDEEGRIVRDRLARNPQLVGFLVSADLHTTGIVVEVEDRPDDENFLTRVVGDLRSLKKEFDQEGSRLLVTGIAVQKQDVSRFVKQDQTVLMPLAVLILAGVLAWASRSMAGVILPLAVTAAATVWTLGIHAFAGYQVNIVTALLPPVIMAISIATGVHLCEEWEKAGTATAGPRDRLRSVLRELGAPVVLTAVTTAVGLASLAVSDIPAVRRFGLFGALGVLVSLFLNLVALPALLFMTGGRSRRKVVHRSLDLLLGRTAAFTAAHPWAILLTALAVTALALPGIAKIRNNTDLVRFLKPDAELVQDTLYVDKHLTGSTALELVVEKADAGPLDQPMDYSALDRMMRQLQALPDVAAVIGVPDLVARVHAAELGLAGPWLPLSREDLMYCFDLMRAADSEGDLRHWVTDDLRRVRLSVRLHAIGTAAAADLLQRFEQVAESVLGERYVVTPTGSYHRVVVDSNRLVRNQVRGFLLALGVILVIIGMVFGSLRLLAVAVIPNLIPILWAGGAIGWFGIDLSTATAMVASVVLGVAVDDTIHYLTRFSKSSGVDAADAVRDTTVHTGRALVFSSVVLALGFWVGALGSFRPTVFFSLLAGGTIVSALLCDLFVLPACLVLSAPQAGRPDR